MPFDVAFALDMHEVKGWGVILGEFESGQTFDWAANQWVKRE